MKKTLSIALCALSLTTGCASTGAVNSTVIEPAAPVEDAVAAVKPEYPSPPEIVAKAEPSEWVEIAQSDLLLMELAPDAKGKARRVVIQLMPAPFSQGWIGNIRKLAAAKFWDGTSVNRVQDNYVVQWGDATEKKALPEGLAVVPESEYLASAESIIAADTNFYESVDNSPTEDTILAGDPDQEGGKPSADTWDKRLELEASLRKIYVIGEDQKKEAPSLDALLKLHRLKRDNIKSDEPLDVATTKSPKFPQGWHERDPFTEWTEISKGWPLGNFEILEWENDDGKRRKTPPSDAEKDLWFEDVIESKFWPVHCYGMVGVGRNLSPDTGTGAELYTVIGHAPRHLDRNIALVGRVIEGIEHLSSLPRGTGPLGFYEKEEERVPILSMRIVSEMESDKPFPTYEYLSTDSASFAAYADARANRRDPFFNVPAGGADICNIPVPVRRKVK